MNVTAANRVIESQNVDSHAGEENIFQEPRSDEPRRSNNDPRQKQKKQNNQPRRDKRDVHGWVVLDKPVGMTSTHAVAVLKRLFQAKPARSIRSPPAGCRSRSGKRPRRFPS
jgi:tRNA pseudouridine55 synthase